MSAGGPAPLVLVADDEPTITLALQLLFELGHLRVAAVHTPREALDRVASGGVRLVVHDLNFSRAQTGGAEGLALLRALRHEDPRLPVIVLTSWPLDAMRARLLREGASACRAKPWDDADLLALVRSLL